MSPQFVNQHRSSSADFHSNFSSLFLARSEVQNQQFYKRKQHYYLTILIWLNVRLKVSVLDWPGAIDSPSQLRQGGLGQQLHQGGLGQQRQHGGPGQQLYLDGQKVNLTSDYQCAAHGLPPSQLCLM